MVLLLFSAQFLLLGKETEYIVFNRLFLLRNNVTTIHAFPRFEIGEMVDKRLNNHQTTTLWTPHGLLPLPLSTPLLLLRIYLINFVFVNNAKMC